MSHPRVLQTLIVEDEVEVRENYVESFLKLGRQMSTPIAEPRFVSSFEEAEHELRSQSVFDIVVLDLCLPAKPGQPAQEGISLGQRLVEICSGRDEHPILAVLVITGYIAKTQQSELRGRLESQFVYGALLAKGGDLMSELMRAVGRIAAHLDAGVRSHVKDNIMYRRNKVVEAIDRCIGDRMQPRDLIVELSAYDPKFSELADMQFAHTIICGRWKSPMKAAYLALRVGAFGEDRDTDGDSVKRRKLSKLFDQTRRVESKRRKRRVSR
jgi:CheY-like chemotaxis protein